MKTIEASNANAGIRILRSVGAGVASILFVVILSTATDMLLAASGVFPALSEPASFTNSLLLLATLYRTVYAIAGGYLIALLAPAGPMAHAVTLGVIGTLVSIFGAIAMWGVGPAWYPIALAVLALPSSVVGASFYKMRVARSVSKQNVVC